MRLHNYGNLQSDQSRWNFHKRVAARFRSTIRIGRSIVITETGVGGILSASHVDRLTGKTHGHSWEVVAWHNCENENDAVVLQNHLTTLLKAWDHTVLPPELASAEGLAFAVMRLSPPSCIEVEVRRPLERLYARAR